MSNTLTIKNLNQIKEIIEIATAELSSGGNEKTVLKDLAKVIDTNFMKIVQGMGGDSWHFKGNTLTALHLALGEID